MDDENVCGTGDQCGELSPRPPENSDLVYLCRHLNEAGAAYVVIGGFAIIHAGYGRFTEDVDLLVDASVENEARVYRALESLPDQAVKALGPGEIAKYVVVRIADEIVVDLMSSACGVTYADAVKEVVNRTIEGVTIPFASPRLLWRMKARTHRAKDSADLLFLAEFFKARGEEPPSL